jgi:predicted chitinase
MKTLTLPIVSSASKDDLIKGILDACDIINVTLPTQRAYLLATAYHETDGFNTLEEYADGDRHDYFIGMYGHRDDLGNIEPEDGFRFFGRGCVQITGRANYMKATSVLQSIGVDIDLVANPELACRPDIACFLLVYMSMYGMYTGVSINDFINENQTDFYDARQVINGYDKADLIAEYTYNWLLEI